ncbi:hypothetical protein [Clostridium sp. VAP52]|nr:hypothetical protein [Clostridium sp. VAP52]
MWYDNFDIWVTVVVIALIISNCFKTYIRCKYDDERDNDRRK